MCVQDTSCNTCRQEQLLPLLLLMLLLCCPSGKLDQAQELAGHLAAAYPGNPSVNMLQAVLLAKSGKVRGGQAVCACVYCIKTAACVGGGVQVSVCKMRTAVGRQRLACVLVHCRGRESFTSCKMGRRSAFQGNQHMGCTCTLCASHHSA